MSDTDEMQWLEDLSAGMARSASRFREHGAAVLAMLRARDAELAALRTERDALRAENERLTGMVTVVERDYKVQLATLRDELARARAFIRDLFADMEWPVGGDLDCFTTQDLAEKHGLLIPQQRTKFCGEGCTCAEYYPEDEQEWTCYRKVDWLTPISPAQATGGGE